MKKLLFITILLFVFTGYTQEKIDLERIKSEKEQVKKAKSKFDKIALNEVFITLDNREINFGEILQNHKGKTIFIDKDKAIKNTIKEEKID